MQSGANLLAGFIVEHPFLSRAELLHLVNLHIMNEIKSKIHKIIVNGIIILAVVF